MVPKTSNIALTVDFSLIHCGALARSIAKCGDSKTLFRMPLCFTPHHIACRHLATNGRLSLRRFFLQQTGHPTTHPKQEANTLDTGTNKIQQTTDIHSVHHIGLHHKMCCVGRPPCNSLSRGHHLLVPLVLLVLCCDSDAIIVSQDDNRTTNPAISSSTANNSFPSSSPGVSSAAAASAWTGTPPTAAAAAVNERNLDAVVGDSSAKNKAAPTHEFSHGLGIFTIASGTGCYEGAHGQAQARFGVADSNIDVFVPSVFAMLEADSSPQDTLFNAVDDDSDGDGSIDRRRRRIHVLDVEGGDGKLLDDDADHLDDDGAAPTSTSRSHECDIFHSGRKSFNQISLELERGANPQGSVMSTSTSYHQHGTFKAREEWFDGLGGQYSIACVHHECLISLHFGTGPSAAAVTGETNGKRGATSLTLQGTTELACQGQNTDSLVCVENCENIASVSTIDTDAEYVEGTINVRAFDNNIVQAHSSHGTRAPKAAKSAKASKPPKGK